MRWTEPSSNQSNRKEESQWVEKGWWVKRWLTKWSYLRKREFSVYRPWRRGWALWEGQQGRRRERKNVELMLILVLPFQMLWHLWLWLCRSQCWRTIFASTNISPNEAAYYYQGFSLVCCIQSCWDLVPVCYHQPELPILQTLVMSVISKPKNQPASQKP